MKAIALGVRFLLELCILASIAAWAALLPASVIERVGVGAGACLVAAVGWGLLLSPKRRYDLPLAVRLVLEAVYFLAAAAALVDIGRPELGLALAGAAVVDRIALAVFNRG